MAATKRSVRWVPVAIVMALATACGGSNLASSPKPERSGPEGFREFAALVDKAVKAKDPGFFGERARLESGVCTKEDVETEIGGPPCETVGEEWRVFRIGHWRSEWTLDVVARATEQLEKLWDNALPSASDDYGDGKPQVYALTMLGDQPSTIVSGLIERPKKEFAGEGPLRVSHVLRWKYVNDRWEFTSILSAYVFAEEFLIPCKDAVPASEGWERYPHPDMTHGGALKCPA